MNHRIIEQLLPLATPCAELREDPSNARKHSPRNLDAIKGSLARYGQRKPLVVNGRDGTVEAGNGTLAAAKALGWTHVAAVFVDDDPTTATGYSIADNRTAELAEWDDAALAALLGSVKGDLCEADLGFSDAEIDTLLAGVSDADAVVVEDPGAGEAPAKPVSERGEVYALGPHRLMCGDSTSAEDVAALMGGERAELCLTDPPYGVGLDYADWEDTKEALAGLQPALAIAREACTVVLMTPGNGNQRVWPAPTWTMCWYVPGAVTRCSWGWCSWQPVLAYGKDPYLAAGMGARPDSFSCNSASEIARTKSGVAGAHPCPKPLKLWEWLLERGQPERGGVYDPFIGSGTTLIACARTGRTCYGMEISPAYCDVIRKRWGDWARAAKVDPGPGAL